jgi:flagellar motility protein MotE (MotC chaperone)
MRRFVHEFRLIPVVLLAIVCLLALKLVGIVLDGGFTLADLDFGSGTSRSDAVSPAAAKGDALPADQRAKTSWAQDMFNFPDVTGSIDSDKQDAARKVAQNAAPPAEAKPSAIKPAEIKPAEMKPGDTKPADKGADTKPADAKAGDTKPADAKAGGVTVIHPEQNGISSPAERAILERLGERRQELDARARELEIRENLLKSAEKRLDGRVNDLKGMESQANGGVQKKQESEAVQLKGLVTMYESMKAKDAAKIFDRLEMPILIAVVSQIKPRVMADIMALMQPEMAERLTVELASRATGIAPKEPAADLPKIEGRTR